MDIKRYQIDFMRSQAMQPHHQQAMRHRKFGIRVLPAEARRVILKHPMTAVVAAAKAGGLRVHDEPITVDLPLPPIQDIPNVLTRAEATLLLDTLWDYALLDKRSYSLILDRERDIRRRIEIIHVKLKDPWFGDYVGRHEVEYDTPEHIMREVADQLSYELTDKRETRIARYLAQLEVLVNEAAA